MISWAQRWGSEVVRWVGEGTDLLLPPGCRWCRAEGDAAPHGLCATCARTFSADSDRCPRCGVAAAASAGGCPRCRRTPPAWDGVVFLGGYDAELREAVLRVKRPGAEPVAEALAALLVEKHRHALAAARLDAVVPVPMHWWRRARRATSPAEEIARAVAREAGLAMSAPLVRHRSTRMQNEVAADERAANVAGAFRTQATVRGRRLLLVDDVVTTGATLDECCRVLRSAGAAAVFCAALARADGARAAADRGWGP